MKKLDFYPMKRFRTFVSSIYSETASLISLSVLLISGTLVMCVSFSSVAYADTLGYPWPTDTEAPCEFAPNGGSSCTNPNDPSGNDKYDWGVYISGAFHQYRNGYEYRNCTDYTQWKESTSPINVSVPTNWGNGGQWYDSAPANEKSTTPKAWDAAVVPGNPGHVAFVESVNTDGTITISEYNHDAQGHGDIRTGTASSMGFTEFVDFGVHPSSSPDNTVLQVKKITQSDGTNEVVWSKGTDVSESWWRSGTGVTLSNLIHISQGDIKSFDIALSSDNKHDLFTATTNNIWETWWYPGQGLHTSEILQNIGNIRKIIKSVGPDGVTQQLYVMTDTGVYEYWWNANSNGIQHDTIMTLANPVDEYKALEPDGTQALYVADQNYPYEQHWGPGITGLQQTTFSSVAGITSISFSQGGANNKHRLYIGSSSGAIWEASWLPNGTVGYWYMTGGSPVVALQKWEDDSTQVIYEATAGGVYEYYWPTTSNTLSGDTIVGLNNVHAFVRSTDPGGVQSVYTATGTNIDESWWVPGGDGIHTGQIE